MKLGKIKCKCGCGNIIDLDAYKSKHPANVKRGYHPIYIHGHNGSIQIV